MHGKRVRKGLKLSALAGLLALIMVMTAFAAHPVPKDDGTGTISITMKTASEKAVPGGTMTIYKVGDITSTDGNYHFTLADDFKDSGIDLDELTQDKFDEPNFTPELAQQFADYVYEKTLEGTTKDIGEDGVVTFGPGLYGLYLFIQETPADGYYAVKPFLASTPIYVPDADGGHYDPTINASPKTEVLPGPVKGVDTEGDEEYDDDGVLVEVGQTLTYRISYTNGHAKAADVIITDTLDENVEYVTGSASDDGVYVSSDHTLTWTLKDVPAYESGYVTFQVTVLEGALEEDAVYNKASVKVDNDYEVDTNVVKNPVPEKDVDVDLTDDKDYGDDRVPVAVGQTLTYKVTYENAHDEAADVVITDHLDDNVSYVAGSASDDGEYSSSDHTIIWTIKDVPADYKGYVTFQVIVLDSAIEPGYVENTAFVKVGNDADVQTNTVYNPVPHKGVDTDGDGEYDDDGKDVYIVEDEDGTKVGDMLTYKIDYENAYDEAVTVTIVDVLDERIDYVSSDPEGEISTDDEGHTVITWTIDNVAPNSTGSVTFTAQVNDKAREINEIENTAQVQVGEDNSYVDTNTVHNPRRMYFQIDEEIVTDTGDIFHYEDGGWIKDESVTEYYDIEMEMTTLLPVIEPDELAEGSFTMNFHEFLDEELKLDHDTVHFSVYIRGNTDDVIDLDDYVDANGEKYYTVTFPTEECTYPGQDPNLCAFHVDVRLTDLYNDGIINAEDLQGDTWITIFFHADLEEDADGHALYGSYSSTVWYEVYDGDNLEHTSNQSVVEVYTYEISIIKYNASRLRNDDYAAAALAGATLGIYADEDCTIPVTRKGTDYTVVSGDDGSVVFFGLAKGTYYVKEISAPSGYILSSSVLTVDFGTLGSNVYVYEDVYANRPRSGGGSGGGGGGSSGGGGGGSGSGGPGSGGSGDGDSGGSTWDLLPLPQTGQGWAMLIAVCAMIVAGIGLIVAYTLRKKD